MTIKIWVDDLRAAPGGWLWAKTYDEAIALLSIHRGGISNVALDHDLGECNTCCVNDVRVCLNTCTCSCHMTGYDVVSWMEAHNVWPKHPPTCHSASPVGARRIWQVINRKYGV